MNEPVYPSTVAEFSEQLLEQLPQMACAARKLRRPRRIAPTTSRWPLGGIEQWPGDYPRFEARLESRLSCPLVLRPSMPWPGQALVVGPGQAELLGQGTISGEQALAKSASSPRPVPALGDDRVSRLNRPLHLPRALPQSTE